MFDPYINLEFPTLNCGGQLVDLRKPLVMGVLNVTPDSFYVDSRVNGNDYLQRAEIMLAEGATFIDVGGMSSRPGAAIVPVEEELNRVLPVIEGLVTTFKDVLVSIDTVHAHVMRAAVKAGATLINDISAGRLDQNVYETVAELEVPYLLMHMKGVPENMQQNTGDDDLTLEVLDFMLHEIGRLRDLGVKDILVDPGFGFGKSLDQNYAMLAQMDAFQVTGCPIVAGISRKSMIYKHLDVSPEAALNGTSVLHMVSLQKGARLLRVHDVKEAVQTIALWEKLNEHEPARR